MKILYYTWNEIIKNDICDAMKAYGHEVKLLSYEIKSYIKDIEFLNIVENELNNGRNCGKLLYFHVILCLLYLKLR